MGINIIGHRIAILELFSNKSWNEGKFRKRKSSEDSRKESDIIPKSDSGDISLNSLEPPSPKFNDKLIPTLVLPRSPSDYGPESYRPYFKHRTTILTLQELCLEAFGINSY